MPMVAPMMMVVLDVVAYHSAANSADNRPDRPGHNGAADRAGRSARDNTLVGRLGRARGAEGQGEAADQNQTLHLGLPNHGLEPG